MPNYRSSIRGFILPLRNLSEVGAAKLIPIFFQSNPQISDAKSANYTNNNPMGRGEGFSNYQNSSNRSFSITLNYNAVSQTHDTYWVAQQVSRLKALVYPIYSRQNRNAKETFSTPPLILLNYGLQYVNIPCKVLSYSSSLDPETPMDTTTMLPYNVSITLDLQTSYPYGYVPGHDDIAGKFSSVDDSGYKGDSILPTLGNTIQESEYEKETPFPQGIDSERKSKSGRSVALTRDIKKITWGNE